MRCNGRKCRSFRAYRILMFFAGLSLLGYIPWKMIAQPEAMTGLYGILFPTASLLAVAGMVLALRPAWAHKLPLAVGLPIGLLAAGWLTTGLECIPTLTRSIMTHPLGGIYATLHMALQHIILSFAVGMLVVAPRATHAFFGMAETPSEAEETDLAADNA